MTHAREADISKLTDEMLNLISVGAYILAGGTPNDDWGQHTDDVIDPDAAFSAACRSCQAVRWLDVAQAELRRRASETDEPSAARQETARQATGPLPLA